MPNVVFGNFTTFTSGAYTYYFGSDGDDLEYYQGADDDPDTVILGFGGTDIITGGGGNDIIAGGFGADVLSGGGGDDSILGEDGNDNITASAGYDTLDGGDGVDTLTVTSVQGIGWTVDLANDFAYQLVGTFLDPAAQFNVAGISNFENVAGSSGDDVIIGDEGDNTLIDGPGSFWVSDNDQLSGGAGDDTLRATAGTDTLDGGLDDDLLEVIGGSGHSLSGGGGADEFRFALGDSQSGHMGTIRDFDWRQGDSVTIDPLIAFEPELDVNYWAVERAASSTLYVDSDGDTEADIWIDVYFVEGTDFVPQYDVAFV